MNELEKFDEEYTQNGVLKKTINSDSLSETKSIPNLAEQVSTNQTIVEGQIHASVEIQDQGRIKVQDGYINFKNRSSDPATNRSVIGDFAVVNSQLSRFNGTDWIPVGSTNGTEFENNSLREDANLLAYYRLEGNGNDALGNFNLTSTGTTTVIYSTAYGKFNQGANMVTGDRFLRILDNLGITGGSITLAGWFTIYTQPSTDTLIGLEAREKKNE